MNLPCVENKQDNFYFLPFKNYCLILAKVSMTYGTGHLLRTVNSIWMTDLGEDKGKFKPSKFINIFLKKNLLSAHFKSYKNVFCISLLVALPLSSPSSACVFLINSSVTWNFYFISDIILRFKLLQFFKKLYNVLSPSSTLEKIHPPTYVSFSFPVVLHDYFQN